MFSFFDKSHANAERALVASHADSFEGTSMSWGSIFAGTLTALVAQLVLNLLGVGIGLSAVSPNGDGAGAEALSIGAGIWLLASSILASALGGYLAGRLSRLPIRSLAGYHGLVTWALTTVVVIFVVTGAVGGVVGSSFNAISGLAGGAGSALGGVVQTASPQLAQLRDPAAKILSQLKANADQPDKVAARNDAIAAVKTALSSDPDKREAATNQAAQALSKLTGTSVDDARTQIASYEDQYDHLVSEAKDKATAVASTAATVASRGALIASFALIVGALAALFAGRFAAVRVQSRLGTS